jgi:hypothetical protein
VLLYCLTLRSEQFGKVVRGENRAVGITREWFKLKVETNMWAEVDPIEMGTPIVVETS